MRSPSRAQFKPSPLGRLRRQLPFQVSLLKARQHSQPRVCLKNSGVRNFGEFSFLRHTLAQYFSSASFKISTMKIKNPICAQKLAHRLDFRSLNRGSVRKKLPLHTPPGKSALRRFPAAFHICNKIYVISAARFPHLSSGRGALSSFAHLSMPLTISGSALNSSAGAAAITGGSSLVAIA